MNDTGNKVFIVGKTFLHLKVKVGRLRNVLFFRILKRYNNLLNSNKAIFIKIKRGQSSTQFLSIPTFNKIGQYFTVTIYHEFAKRLNLKAGDDIEVEIKELLPIQNEKWLINDKINLLAFLPGSFIAIKLTDDKSLIWELKKGRGYRSRQIEITYLIDANLCSYVMGLLLAEGDKRRTQVLRFPNKFLGLQKKFVAFVKMLGNFNINGHLHYNPIRVSIKNAKQLRLQYENCVGVPIHYEVVESGIKDYVYASSVNSQILAELIKNVFIQLLYNFAEDVSPETSKLAHMFLLGVIAGDGSVEVYIRGTHIAQELSIALESEETCKKLFKMCKNLGYSAYIRKKKKRTLRISLDTFKALQLLSIGIFDGNKNRAKLICAVAAKRNIFLFKMFKLYKAFSQNSFSIEDAQKIIQRKHIRDTLLRMRENGYIDKEASNYKLNSKGFTLMKTYEEVLKESEKLLEYFKDDSLIETIRKLKNGKHCEVYPLS
jgi:hypothetical protein